MFIETAILDPSLRWDDGEFTVTPAQAGAQNLSGHPIGRHTNCSSNRKGRLPRWNRATTDMTMASCSTGSKLGGTALFFAKTVLGIAA
jgi:hypothetical protein